MRLPVLLALALMWHSTSAETLIAAMADKDYPPFYYYDKERSAWAGISVEVCEIVVGRAGYDLAYERYPFSRMLQYVGAGKADIACTLFNTAQRAPGVTYTAVPHAFEDIWVFGRKDVDWSELDIDQLRTFKLGGVRAYFYGNSMEDDASFKKLLVNNEEQLIKVLIGGRIDYALGNKASIELYAERLGVTDQIRFMENPIYKGPIYIAVSRTREDAHRLVSDFSRAIADFRETDEYAALLLKYGLGEPAY